MYPAAETEFFGIFSILVTVYMHVLTVRPVIFHICEIAAMHFKFISCDMQEWSFQTKYKISFTDLQVYHNKQIGSPSFVHH